MDNEEMIAIDICCTQYNVDINFISGLQQYGLIEVTTVSNTPCVPAHELGKLERLIRLHYDMDINLEGIEAICHLLDRMEALQQEMLEMKNRLRLYEG